MQMQDTDISSLIWMNELIDDIGLYKKHAINHF